MIPVTGRSHIHHHDVSETEIDDVLAGPIEDREGEDGSRVAIGQTEGGRYLRVIYVWDREPGEILIVAAHELGPKALHALRRRRRRRM